MTNASLIIKNLVNFLPFFGRFFVTKINIFLFYIMDNRMKRGLEFVSLMAMAVLVILGVYIYRQVKVSSRKHRLLKIFSLPKKSVQIIWDFSRKVHILLLEFYGK